MSLYLRRQIKATSAAGELTALSDVQYPNFTLTDSLPKYAQKIGYGKLSYGFFKLDAGDSFVLPLPEEYSDTERLSFLLRCSKLCKVVVVSPSFGTSTYLIKGTDDTSKGVHPGLLMFQSDVTSITVSVPSGEEVCEFRYIMHEVPDLDIAGSYRIGQLALGVAM